MERKLKDLFRRSGSLKSSTQNSQRSGRTSTDKNRSQARVPKAQTTQDAERQYELASSPAQEAEAQKINSVDSRFDEGPKAKAPKSERTQSPTGVPCDSMAEKKHILTPSAQSTHSPAQQNTVEVSSGHADTQTRTGSFADDYVAYLPALADGDPEQGGHMSNDGDKRPLTETNNVKRSQDLVDSKVESLATQDASPSSFYTADHHTRESSRSVGSMNTSLVGKTFDHDNPLTNGDSELAQTASRYNDHSSQAPNATDAKTPVPFTTDHNDQDVQEKKERLMADPAISNVVDLSNTVDTDRTTRWAPVVTHETVRREEKEIVQELIYREIHHHDVYHRILPVVETEILPARHFVENPEGEGLIEVSADHFPNSTVNEDFRRWYESEQDRRFPPNTATYVPLSAPAIIDDRKTLKEGAFELRDTTIQYPPMLDDLGGYGGPVRSIFFGDSGKLRDDGLQTLGKNNGTTMGGEVKDPFNLGALGKNLPRMDVHVPANATPSRTSSLRHRKHNASLRDSYVE